jgi:predicted amidohydrolase
MKIVSCEFTARPRLIVAGMQIKSRLARTKEIQLENARQHLALADRILGKANMVLFPELSTLGTTPRPDPNTYPSHRDIAEKLDGPVCQLFQSAARATHTWIGFGLRTHGPYGSTLNTYVIATGNPATSFVMHATQNRYLSFTLNGIKIAATICHNAEDPSFKQHVVDHNADLAVVPMDSHMGMRHPILLKTNLLTINYAGENAGYSNFHHYFRGMIRAYGLGPDEGMIIAKV